MDYYKKYLKYKKKYLNLNQSGGAEEEMVDETNNLKQEYLKTMEALIENCTLPQNLNDISWSWDVNNMLNEIPEWPYPYYHNNRTKYLDDLHRVVHHIQLYMNHEIQNSNDINYVIKIYPEHIQNLKLFWLGTNRLIKNIYDKWPNSPPLVVWQVVQYFQAAKNYIKASRGRPIEILARVRRQEEERRLREDEQRCQEDERRQQEGEQDQEDPIEWCDVNCFITAIQYLLGSDMTADHEHELNVLAKIIAYDRGMRLDHAINAAKRLNLDIYALNKSEEFWAIIKAKTLSGELAHFKNNPDFIERLNDTTWGVYEKLKLPYILLSIQSGHAIFVTGVDDGNFIYIDQDGIKTKQWYETYEEGYNIVIHKKDPEEFNKFLADWNMTQEDYDAL